MLAFQTNFSILCSCSNLLNLLLNILKRGKFDQRSPNIDFQSLRALLRCISEVSHDILLEDGVAQPFRAAMFHVHLAQLIQKCLILHI